MVKKVIGVFVSNGADMFTMTVQQRTVIALFGDAQMGICRRREAKLVYRPFVLHNP